MRRIAFIALVLLLCAGLSAFAAEKKSKTIPWMASFNQAGQLNGYLSAGIDYWGIAGSAGAELILGEFDIADIPLSWGVMARGIIGLPIFYGYAGIDWGAAGLATLHWGMDFGASSKFDVYAGLGAGVLGVPWSPFSVAFSQFAGVSWFMSDKLTLIVEDGYFNGFTALGGWLSYWGAGVQIKL
jgi:hypothetical protein